MIPVLRKKLDRVLLKLSGAALAGDIGQGIDPAAARYIAEEVVSVHNSGVATAVVVGGGNFVRGRILHEEGGMDQAVADSMGMLGTIINGVALQEAIERLGVPTRVMSAIDVQAVCEPFIRRRALRHLEKGRIVILVAGTGNPFFTTDTAGVLRALEIGAEAVVKATGVDGVYDKDPKKSDDATKYDTVSFEEAIRKQLAVMDQTAFTLCREHNLPIIVLSLAEKGAMQKAVLGEPIGTWVGGE